MMTLAGQRRYVPDSRLDEIGMKRSEVGMEFCIIGDVAGEFDTLKALVDKMPRNRIILVGDLVDRGPKSKEVLEWAMRNNDQVSTVLGNHEQMMVEAVYGGSRMGWFMNGGGATARQFIADDGVNIDVPKEIIDWILELPLYLQFDDLLVTHAGVTSPDFITNLAKDRDYFIWNRNEPGRRDRYQVFGHNSQFGLRTFSDSEGAYATCIDTSRSRVLTGMHWPSREIFQQPYI